MRTGVKNISDRHHLCFSYRPRSLKRPAHKHYGLASGVVRCGLENGMDADLLTVSMAAAGSVELTVPPVNPTTINDTKAEAERLVGYVTAAYDTALPPRNSLPSG